MKNELKVSRFVLVCALCLGSYASYGASSVRALGGSGTYTSASSASSASSAKATAVRGGSMRVTPSANKGGSSTTTGSVGTTVKTPRLSIGNYLGGGTSISGGSSLRPQQPGGGSSSGGGSVDPDLNDRLNQIDDDLADLKDRTGDLETDLQGKQDELYPTDGIIVIDQDRDEIFVDVEELKNQLELTAGQDGREVEIGRNETHLLWHYVGESTWNDLIAIEELRGPQGEPGEPGMPADMSNYYTKEEMELALNQAIQNAGHVTKEELAEVAFTGSYNDLADKPTIPEGVVVDTELTDGGVNAVQGGVIKAAIDKKADKTELNAKADQTAVDDLEGRVGTVESGVANAELTANTAKEIANSVKTDLSKKEDVANKVGSVGFDAAAGDDTKYPSVKAVADKLNEKANASELANYATKEALEGKADKATTLAGYGITDAYTKEQIDEMALGGEVDLSGYQRTDKRVDTVRDSATATDDNYPSEKAVATALEGKADSGALADLATKEELEGVKTTAETAQSTAGEAKTTAETAKTTAETAKTTADSAKADAAQALTEATEAKTAVNSKVDKVQGAGEANKVLITDGTGNVITGTVSSGMITDGTISDADIAPDAAISRSKLAPDVQTSLDTADKAVSMEGADINSVLGTDESGNKVWYKIAF